MKLLNQQQLAAELGVSTWFTGAMKRAGAPFWGRLTSVQAVTKWLNEHPEFSASATWRKRTTPPVAYNTPPPALLTAAEFGCVIGRHPEVVRRMIRSRQIKAKGRPYQIPVRELERFGVNVADAGAVLADRARLKATRATAISRE